jgi:hypothetical protein
MKAFNRIFAVVVAAILVVFVIANVVLFSDNSDNGRPYRVEINRLVYEIENDSFAIE